MNRQGVDMRTREGEGARWGGVVPTRDDDGALCAEEVVGSGTRVYLQALSGPREAKVISPLLRAELGATFTLRHADLPLSLTIDAADAVMHGSEGVHTLSSLEPSTDAPELYATLYTEHLDMRSRHLAEVKHARQHAVPPPPRDAVPARQVAGKRALSLRVAIS